MIWWSKLAYMDEGKLSKKEKKQRREDNNNNKKNSNESNDVSVNLRE